MTARTFQSFSGGYAGPVHATRYNTIVIGMGGMGSAAAYHLAYSRDSWPWCRSWFGVKLLKSTIRRCPQRSRHT
ncbi:MAG: hypothetical protein QOJ47_23 [Gaiellales bacterium]|nr:hypothetical protein [Gaiellales bacterium]